MENEPAWLKPPFPREELDGAVVDFETEGGGSGLGVLRAFSENPEGLIRLRLEIKASAAGDPVRHPLQELFSFEALQRHPKPERAAFLLAINATELLARMD